MRFLADENCDFAVVRALRAARHDVLAAAELGERSVDALLLEMAHHEGRILLTEDKDFGWLAFVAHAESAGVILMRFPIGSRSSLSSSITRLVEQRGSILANAFVVLSPGSVRIARSPGRIV